MFHDHLTQLLKELHVEGTVPKEMETISLNVGETPISITDAPPGIDLFANLGTLPDAENHEPLYEKLLRGNFLGQATVQSFLALDEEGKSIVLLASCPAIRSYKEFRDTLEDFVNTVAFWKEEIKNV